MQFFTIFNLILQLAANASENKAPIKYDNDVANGIELMPSDALERNICVNTIFVSIAKESDITVTANLPFDSCNVLSTLKIERKIAPSDKEASIEYPAAD